MDSVKVWSALNGSTKKKFSSVVSQSEITAFTLDTNKKRFIVGDSKGQVRVFNLHNGQIMKTLQEFAGAESAEIICVHSVRTKEMAMVVSASAAGVINVHEDDSLFSTAIRRTILIPHNYQVQAVAIYAA
mmetsp:Transcript_35915/g.26676  ORF Transcript_35915/g.26676 Transcript_35915/m.26676 type:complete len:130 (-) Transcript_35915:203-592(-)